MIAAYDIVGFTFQAQCLCPGCTATLVENGLDKRWMWAAGLGRCHPDTPVHEWLAEIARYRHIDWENEASYDSDDFPKVIFRDQLGGNGGSFCHECGEQLG